MNEYLELKFANDFKDTFLIKLVDYNKEATDLEIRNAMEKVTGNQVFEGKNGVLDKIVEANRVTIQKQAVVVTE